MYVLVLVFQRYYGFIECGDMHSGRYGSILRFLQKIKEDVQIQEVEEKEEEEEEAAEKEAEVVAAEMPIMLEANNFEELTHTVAWLNICSVNYLAWLVGLE